MDLSVLTRYIQNVFAFDPETPLLFTQFHFWAFFSLVFMAFAIFQHRAWMRNAYLFAVSLLFYYKTSGAFVGLLVLVTCSDFFIAQFIYKCKARWAKRAWLSLSVCIDLGILCYFKYSYFFADIINQMFGTEFEVTNVAGKWLNELTSTSYFSVDKIILPVGISFYTFQIVSYTADVYKGLVKPVRNILDFGFYVSFFPQLVAGPIIKASDFIPQLYRRYFLSRRQFGIAIFWIVNGLIKKIVLSDYLAVNFIDRVFDNPMLFTGFENLAALFLYSLQVYADFSGYTDIAIGLSMLMGFHLPRNFNSPYKALNCSNFWKRWHISLSRWLQTYLYIPLGGNRNISFGTIFWIIVLTLSALILSGSLYVSFGVLVLAAAIILTAWYCPERRRKIWANLNSMITMLLGGLWHGASMNFLIWGGLNGIGMVVFKFWRDSSLLVRCVGSTMVVLILWLLATLVPSPVWNMFLVYVAFIMISAWIRMCYLKMNLPHCWGWLEHAWCILVTFTFITFTRLFFRSGSNLDPAIANETAWNTATDMVTRIGSAWSGNVWEIVQAYSNVFSLFVMGMIIHWLPENWKRRYRIGFSKLPLPVMCLICVLAVFFIYQFVTAKMQPFIYFQF
jgi:D-alanyl-lipoteichoic acid acyltransferase DltB (MBOAT superfamily)